MLWILEIFSYGLLFAYEGMILYRWFDTTGANQISNYNEILWIILVLALILIVFNLCCNLVIYSITGSKTIAIVSMFLLFATICLGFQVGFLALEDNVYDYPLSVSIIVIMVVSLITEFILMKNAKNNFIKFTNIRIYNEALTKKENYERDLELKELKLNSKRNIFRVNDEILRERELFNRNNMMKEQERMKEIEFEQQLDQFRKMN